MAKRRWSDLSALGVVLAGAVQLGLLLVALADIYRRPAPLSLLLMLAVSGLLYLCFKRAGWLCRAASL